jgi:hypothetical protein
MFFVTGPVTINTSACRGDATKRRPNSRAAAQLAQDMAQQINALALAHQSAVRQARLAIGLAIAAVVLAIASVIVAFQP